MNNHNKELLEDIPFIDIRGSSPTQLLELYANKAQNLVEASKNTFGLASKLASHLALPIADQLARAWLHKTQNPYRNEIELYTKILPIKGLLALNLSYEWGCTSGAYKNDGRVTLLRVLDWPFPALGSNIVVAHQRGSAGDFYNITWPGVSGIFQAITPGRFAAALNQAPMRRYKTGIVIDWIRNRARFNKSSSLPPAHLLRKAFETANSYEEAKAILSQHSVSIPVIYTLSGTQEQEGCVIERLEDSFSIRELSKCDNVCATNHFESSFNGIGHGWLPRAMDSHGRASSAKLIDSKDLTDDFLWFAPQIVSHLSRLVMTADASSGTFSLMATDGVKPVTKRFAI
jgi:hypothetical protein